MDFKLEDKIMKKLVKKLGVMFVVCAVVGTMSTGCGEKKADSAQGAVEGFLEASKEVDFDKMANYTTDDAWDDQVEEMMTIDAWKNFLDITAPKMTYEIKNVAEDGAQTVVTVQIKYVDGTEAYTAAMNEYFTQAIAMMSEDEEIDEQAIVDLLDEILKEKAKDMEEKYSEKTIDFICENGDDYRINNVDAEFAAVVTANLTAIADSLGEDVIAE